MSNNLYLGIIASIYGMGGVFAVLILFYIVTKILMKIFTKEVSRTNNTNINKAA